MQPKASIPPHIHGKRAPRHIQLTCTYARMNTGYFSFSALFSEVSTLLSEGRNWEVHVRKLLNALYIYVRVVRPFVCANCMCVYTIERAYARAYICACTCIRVSLRLFTCINTNAVSYVRMHAGLRADLIKTQNTFAHKIFQHSNALWVQKLSGCTISITSLAQFAVWSHDIVAQSRDLLCAVT